MQTVLITGGMGFLGSHLCERLLKRGKTVWALDLFEPPHAARLRDYARFHLVIDTIKNRATLEKLVARADVVCHLAAIACPDEYVTNPRKVMDITLHAALELVDMVRLTDKFLFFTSTSEVYGRNPRVPFREDDERVLGSTEIPRWCYATSKAAVEHYIKACHAGGQLDYAIVRLFNVYGPYLHGRVVSRFVDAALEGRPLLVYGDGSQTRCFTYVDDVIDGILAILEQPAAHNRTFNIGNPVETSIRELAERVVAIAGASPELVCHVPSLAAIGAGYEDVPRRVPDVSRIEKLLGWRPRVDLDTGLERMIEAKRPSCALTTTTAIAAGGETR